MTLTARLLRRITLLGLGLLPLPLLAGPGLDGLNRFLAETRTLSATFTQSVTGKSGRKAQQSSGVMQFSRPGRFRWQIDKPYVQLMIGDGERFWIYDPDLRQITVKKLGAALGSTPAALLAGKDVLSRHFQLKEEGEQDGLHWVEAIPKSADSGFERVRLGFSGKTLQAMQLFDSFGQTTRLHFGRIEINPALPAGQFRMVTPPGVDVVGE